MQELSTPVQMPEHLSKIRAWAAKNALTLFFLVIMFVITWIFELVDIMRP